MKYDWVWWRCIWNDIVVFYDLMDWCSEMIGLVGGEGGVYINVEVLGSENVKFVLWVGMYRYGCDDVVG